MLKRLMTCLSFVSLVTTVGACTATPDDATPSRDESDVQQTGSQTARFLHTTRLEEGEVTFCLTRHPLDPTAIKFSRCNADPDTASDANAFQVVTIESAQRHPGVFSLDGTKQLIIDTQMKRLSFVNASTAACAAPVACVRSGKAGLTFWDPSAHRERALATVMAGSVGADDVTSGANNALDAHFGIADRSNVVLQPITKPMVGIAKACTREANGDDSCTTEGKVCRLESVDHCKSRCPLAAGPELWTCLDTCERPGAPATAYYERIGYCGPKNIQERCQEGDDTVVACSGSQVWAGGFDCKNHEELFRCDDGQTCRSFVSAVDASGQHLSVEQLKSALCKPKSSNVVVGGEQDI